MPRENVGGYWQASCDRKISTYTSIPTSALSPKGREPYRPAFRAKASTGLGALRWLWWQILKVEDMYATFFVIALLGAVLSYGLAALCARWLPWVQDVGTR
jgi:hypothetical protein